LIALKNYQAQASKAVEESGAHISLRAALVAFPRKLLVNQAEVGAWACL